ncbi:hypothetical protein ISCGN_012207 [Ixodes scapularis]
MELVFILFIIFEIICISAAEKVQVAPFYFPEKTVVGDTIKIICYTNTEQTPLSFTWMKDSKPLRVGDTVRIKTQPDLSAITLGPATASHSGNYTCRASTAKSSSAYSAQLNVFGSTQQPLNIQSDGSIFFVRVQKESQGMYRCSAANGIGAPLNKTVKVTVTDVPEIQPMTFPSNLKEGARFRATCSVITGSPPFTFRWLKNNKDLQEDGAVTIENWKDYSSLVITKLAKSHAANYTCIATNAAGSDRYTNGLVVNVPARFEEKFKVQTVRRGEGATLQCTALGDTPLEISWSQEKKPLAFAPVTRYEKFESTTEQGVSSELLIPTTDRSDAALYTCVAKNEYGSDERNIKLLVVEVPAQPLDLRILEVWNRKVNVMWSEPYSGNSPVTNYVVHYWRDKEGPHRLHEETVSSTQTSAVIAELHPDTWNGELKGYYIGYRSAESNQPYSFKTVETVTNDTQEVTLVGLSKSSRYSVIVRAYNAIGKGPPSEALVVRTLDGDVPPPPALSLISSSDSAFKIRWAHARATAAPITGYTLHYKKGSGPWHHIPVVASDDTSYTLTDLDGGATYRVYLTASNQYGRGSGSEAIIINTVGQDTWNGELKGYYIGYRSAESNQPYSFKTVETVTNDTQEVTLVGLSKSSRYSVIVRAYNAIGKGPPSEALVVRTLDGDVPPPPALSLISSSDSAFKIRWAHARATAAPITGYTLHYKKGSGPWHHIPVVASDDTSYTLTDLDGGATYRVYLTASNQYGRGSGSEAIIINTVGQGSDKPWVFYKDPSLLVPVASFLVALLVVIGVVSVCIKKTKAHKNLERSALEAEKRQSYAGDAQQRYIDVQEKRGRSDYATIQSRRSLSGTYKLEELRGAVPQRGCNTTEAKDRRRSSLRKSSASSHLYDSAA